VILLSFEVRSDRQINKQLTRLSRSGEKRIVERITQGLDQLAVDPLRPRPGVDILQLKDLDPAVYRMRIGDYRILFTIDKRKRIVWITGILHRKRAYRM